MSLWRCVASLPGATHATVLMPFRKRRRLSHAAFLADITHTLPNKSVRGRSLLYLSLFGRKGRSLDTFELSSKKDMPWIWSVPVAAK